MASVFLLIAGPKLELTKRCSNWLHKEQKRSHSSDPGAQCTFSVVPTGVQDPEVGFSNLGAAARFLPHLCALRLTGSVSIMKWSSEVTSD